MQAKTQKLPWNLQIQAKAKHFNFNFKLRLNVPESNLKLHRFSLLLKLRKWRLRVESDSGSPALKTELLKRNGSVTSKFIRIFQKLRPRRWIKGQPALSEKSAIFAIAENRLVKCAALSAVLATAIVASALGFDATKLLELR